MPNSDYLVCTASWQAGLGTATVPSREGIPHPPEVAGAPTPAFAWTPQGTVSGDRATWQGRLQSQHLRSSGSHDHHQWLPLSASGDASQARVFPAVAMVGDPTGARRSADAGAGNPQYPALDSSPHYPAFDPTLRHPALSSISQHPAHDSISQGPALDSGSAARSLASGSQTCLPAQAPSALETAPQPHTPANEAGSPSFLPAPPSTAWPEQGRPQRLASRTVSRSSLPSPPVSSGQEKPHLPVDCRLEPQGGLPIVFPVSSGEGRPQTQAGSGGAAHRCLPSAASALAGGRPQSRAVSKLGSQSSLPSPAAAPWEGRPRRPSAGTGSRFPAPTNHGAQVAEMAAPGTGDCDLPVKGFGDLRLPSHCGSGSAAEADVPPLMRGCRAWSIQEGRSLLPHASAAPASEGLADACGGPIRRSLSAREFINININILTLTL